MDTVLGNVGESIQFAGDVEGVEDEEQYADARPSPEVGFGEELSEVCLPEVAEEQRADGAPDIVVVSG